MSDYKKDKEKIIERYNQRISKFGGNPESLAGGNELRRNIRYKILSEVLDLTGKTVLDLGCGFGGFYKYLSDRKIDCDYTGYDINENIIKIANENFSDAKFEAKDILEDDFPEFDVIVSSSSFNNKLGEVDNYTFIKSILNKCYLHSKEAVAIDFLTSYVDYKHDYAFYYEPEKVLEISKSITRRISIRHDYPLFEFCIYMYRDTVFPY